MTAGGIRFSEALGVWARIGLLSFGGPAGQIALMHRILVEERRWIGEQRFLHALNYCMLLPGPEAQQLATYVGWLMHRTAGGLAAGLLFILPGAVVMLGLSILYALLGGAPLAEGLFLGVKAAVLAVVIQALWRIGRRALKGVVHYAVATAAFLALFVFDIPFPLVVLAAALIGWFVGGPAGGPETDAGDHPDAAVVDRMFARGELAHARPSGGRALGVLAVWLPLWLGPAVVLALVLGQSSFWTQLAAYFSTMGVVTFGGAYAVLAYVAQAAVETFGWLTPGQMADGLGLAETTPGPLILVLQFVGFMAAYQDPGALPPLLAGGLASGLTTWIIFAPSFLWIFLGGPYVEQLRSNRRLAAALASVTAAVVGVIANLALWFAVHTLFGETTPGAWGLDLPGWTSFDWRAGLLAVAACVALLRFKVGLPWVLAASALAGAVLSLILGS